MKVLVIGGSSAPSSTTSRMLAELRQVCGSDVEVVHQPDGKMQGHRADVLIVDEIQNHFADLERRVMSNLNRTQLRALDYLDPTWGPIKPKPNKGPRGRWNQ